jgi:hypothetical protein
MVAGRWAVVSQTFVGAAVPHLDQGKPQISCGSPLKIGRPEQIGAKSRAL